MIKDCPECGGPMEPGSDFGDYCMDCKICWMGDGAGEWEFR